MLIFDYFEIADRPVIVDRRGGVAWEWSRGEWRDAPDLASKSYVDGNQLEREDFVQLYPYADLDLLILPSDNLKSSAKDIID